MNALDLPENDRARPAHIVAALAEASAGRLVAGILNAASYQWTTEDELQAALAEVLDRFEVYPEREARLSDARSRVDLLAGGVVIEVKIDGSWSDVTRQLTRYARCPEVVSLVLVTTKARHQRVPTEVAGKPVSLVWIGGGGL